MLGDEGVRTGLSVLRRLLVIGHMATKVHNVVHLHREGVRSARIDNHFKVGLALDRLAVRRRSPVVLLANQDERE